MSFGAAQKAHIYHEFAKLLEAGFGIDKAADTVLAQRPPAKLRTFAEGIKEGLDNGRSIADSVGAVDLDISELEARLISAGEKGGRVEDAFAHLAHYFEMLHETRRRIFGRLVYPVLLMHFAVFLLAVPRAVAGTSGPGGYVGAVALQLGVIYLVVGGALFLWKKLSTLARRNENIDRVLNRLPISGRARKSIALSRFCKVFEIFLLSGQTTSESVRAAGDSSGSGEVTAAAHRLEETARGGDPIGPGLLSEPAFPNDLARSLASSEEAGGLEKDLRRWSALMRANADEAMERVGDWIPKILYFLIVVLIAYQIISIWSDLYLGQYRDFDPYE